MIEKLPPWETIVRQREKIRLRTTTESPKSNNIYEKFTRPGVVRTFFLIYKLSDIPDI